MNAPARYFHDVVRDNWSQSRPGRAVDVPAADAIDFVLEKNQSKFDGRTEDVVHVSGGGHSPTPNGVNWQYERLENSLTIYARAQSRRESGSKVDGRERLFGYRNTGSAQDTHGLDPGESEDWGGLVGEIRYILNERRKLTEEWDHVTVQEVQDISDTVGKNYYRAAVEVTATEIARPL